MDLPHSFLKRQQRIHKEENHFAAVIEVTFKNSLNALYFHIFMADHVIATLTSKYTAPLMNHWIPLGEESLGGKIFSNNSSSKVYTIHNLIIKLSTEIQVLQWVLDYFIGTRITIIPEMMFSFEHVGIRKQTYLKDKKWHMNFQTPPKPFFIQLPQGILATRFPYIILFFTEMCSKKAYYHYHFCSLIVIYSKIKRYTTI